MATKANVKDIQWSRQQYSLREAIKRCTFPQIMKVVQGYESSDETESLALGQILRINQIHTQTRVLGTTEKKGRWLSIPLRYAEARFEILTGSKRSKPMYMREIIDKSLLPQKVQFFTGDDLTFHLQLKSTVPNTKEKFGALTLHKMYETAYLQGNAIQNDHLDTMVLNIPLHSPVSVVLAESFIVGSRDRWERYQTLLDKIVSKNVTFALHPGNPHITFFTDKKLESANQQEQYEQITPAGTLFIMTKNELLKQNKGPSNMLSGPSGARTMSAVSAARSKSPEIDRDNASVQAGGDRQGRPKLRSSQSSMAVGAFMTARPRLMSPSRTPSNGAYAHGTMPRNPKSILKTAPGNAGDMFPPPPAELLNSPVRNPMAYIPNDRPQSPPPQQGVRRRTSHSPGRLDNRAKSPIRADFPRPVTVNTASNPSPRGSPSADSGYSTTSSNDSRMRPPTGNKFLGQLPEPDYDRDHDIMTNGQGNDSVDYPSLQRTSKPPDPPPVATIPSKAGVPNGGAPPGPPPPPPPIGFTPIPKPPVYSDVQKIKASQASQGQRQSPASKSPLQSTNARDDMLQEIKLRAERRLSRMEDGIIIKNVPKFGNRSSPRGPTNSPRPINNNVSSSGNELQALLAKRKSLSQADGGDFPDSATATKMPPPPAAKPSPRIPNSNNNTPTSVAKKFTGGKNSPRTNDVTFGSLSEVPKDLSVLSVSQVCQCMKLMNLDKHSATFKSNSVDGQLMLQLNKDALKESFKLSDWDAQRVESFIKGWRPKY